MCGDRSESSPWNPYGSEKSSRAKRWFKKIGKPSNRRKVRYQAKEADNDE